MRKYYPINLDTTFYPIRYTAKDEEDMTEVDVQNIELPKRSTERKDVIKTTNTKINV